MNDSDTHHAVDGVMARLFMVNVFQEIIFMSFRDVAQFWFCCDEPNALYRVLCDILNGVVIFTDVLLANAAIGDLYHQLSRNNLSFTNW